MKKIIIVGGSGFVGSVLSEKLLEKSYSVLVLDINEPKNKNVEFYKISLDRNLIPENFFQNVLGIVNLAGAPISGKWTKEYKKVLRDSRIETTKNIIKSIEKIPLKPEVLVSASAVGFYGDGKDMLLSEDSQHGNDFLANICTDWESEAMQAKNLGVRTVILRTSHVLGLGGILSEMLKMFRRGMGGYFGNGRQYMPWVHVDDLVSQYIFAIENKDMSGVYNTSAGELITQKTFMKSIQKVFGFYFTLSVPAFVAKIVKGEFAKALLGGQKINSSKIKNTGFRFRFENVEKALKDIKNRFYDKS